tara:strand:- start:665 stop:1159 length:495 start_codon:yes stop_codon:yes gene_type:complete
MFKNICLIGLPYSGKSYLGQRLAQYKNIGFIDIDKIIELKYKKKLHEIISDEGINKFIHYENKIASSLYCHNNIISPGGSIIYSAESMYHIKNTLNSDIIHLHLSFNEFETRITNISERGIIMKAEYDVKQLYDERISLCNYYSDRNINVDNIDNIYKNIKQLK